MTFSLTRQAFRRLVLQALDALPPELRGYLDNVDIVVQAWPSQQHLQSTETVSRYDLLGLYEGIPQTERFDYNLTLPDKITLFQRPLQAACATRDDLVQEVQVTVAHEIAHHFGIDDARLDALGLS
jgi:predicted Zn-dependent protease with MMP-like domain